jgi:hypothetical protein
MRAHKHACDGNTTFRAWKAHAHADGTHGGRCSTFSSCQGNALPVKGSEYSRPRPSACTVRAQRVLSTANQWHCSHTSLPSAHACNATCMLTVTCMHVHVHNADVLLIDERRHWSARQHALFVACQAKCRR